MGMLLCVITVAVGNAMSDGPLTGPPGNTVKIPKRTEYEASFPRIT